MPSPRTVIQDIWLEPGTVISDREWARTTFRQCRTRRSADLALRPRLERLTFTDVKLEWSPAKASIITDVAVRGLRKDDSSMFFTGCTYDRVTFTGDCGSTILGPSLSIGGELSHIHRAAVLEHDRTSPHYSIDISRARGDFEVRGYRASRMILNPELHAIVRLEDVIGRDISWLRGKQTTFDIAIARLMERGYEDALLCAYPKSKYFDAQLAAIARLRADGIADTDSDER
ncbi:hypothetical protein [Clavibacter sp. VKM Ac-2872]|uniref:hypothetical protein n=1 Tax=Clavibacter sp. VKM Ac-2872 TaxID=2783812 RepID=UPI00188D40D7|nr:hypothetical protein [Clavibacter sp. VKM Ac-2872]MBF4622897.1 hypothetical protein [Clavibacter sp. VKM Ac-2872]